MDLALRPMSTSQVLDRTFYLYRNNFVLFAGIAMVAPALALIAGVAQFWIFGIPVAPKFEGGDPAVVSSLYRDVLLRAAIGGVISLIIYAVGTALAAGATMYAVSMVHLGKSTTIAESYAKIKPIFWRILKIVVAVLLIAILPLLLIEGSAVGIIALQIRAMSNGVPSNMALVLLFATLLFLAGILLSVVWLFYALCRYSLAVPACVLEDLTPRQALSRSSFLIKKGLGRILAVYLLTMLMGFVLTSVLQLPAYLFGNVFALKPGMHMSAFTLIWLFTGEFIGKTLAGPIVTIAIALLYYDQRIRKEAFDLHLMMETMTQQPQQPMPVAVPPAIG